MVVVFLFCFCCFEIDRPAHLQASLTYTYCKWRANFAEKKDKIAVNTYIYSISTPS